MIIQVVGWVELPEQRRLCPIFCANMDPDKWDTTVWYQVIRNPQEFRGLSTGLRIWGVTHHVKFEPKPTLFGLPSCKKDQNLNPFFLSLKIVVPFFLYLLPNTNKKTGTPYLTSFFFIQTMGFAHWSSPLMGGPNKSPLPPHVMGLTNSSLYLQASNFSLGKHLVNMFDPFLLVCNFSKYNCFHSNTSRIQ